MKTAIITPAICKEEASDYEGVIEMRPPLAEERFEYFDISGLKFGADFTVDVKNVNGMGMIRALIPHVKKHIVSVDMKRKSDGYKLDCYEDLSQDPGTVGVVTELAMMLLQGFKPSKNSKPS
jgi:hypothetical protein